MAPLQQLRRTEGTAHESRTRRAQAATPPHRARCLARQPPSLPFRSPFMRPSGLAFLALLAFAIPAGAQSTVCSDGSTSAATGRGACSAHGGVDAAATKAAAAKAKRAARKAQPGPISYKPRVTAITCKDGTATAGGQGACSHHGGVGTVTTTKTTIVPPPMSAPMPAPTTTTPRMSPPPARTSPIPEPRTRTSNSPAGASAQCRDGSYSYSAHRKGTCSHHGGVATWLGLAN